MSPSETAPPDQPLLERPEEAFDYFARSKVERVVCEEKHMGSRAVVVVARDVDAAQRRFGVGDGKQGVVYTRTGRPFFSGDALEGELVRRVAEAASGAGLWDELGTDWMCMDAELMPWSFKARELLRTQYAAVGSAAEAAMAEAVRSLESAAARTEGARALLERFRDRRAMLGGYSSAWRRYCWDADGLDGVKLAPFHLLASEGTTHLDQPHPWHMDTLARLAEHDDLLVATPYRIVELDQEGSREEAAAWWRDLTGEGGEGMVVKPEHWIVRGPKGLVQPALKCRGPEYLRIIYGPEYSAPENLERLRKRGLSTKRGLAMREFALGLEGLYRFVEKEPLWRVHECVFGVLALESEPVDPRL